MSAHLTLSAALAPGLRRLLGRAGAWWRRRAIRIDPAAVGVQVRRDLGLETGRAAPPRDPYRD